MNGMSNETISRHCEPVAKKFGRNRTKLVINYRETVKLPPEMSYFCQGKIKKMRYAIYTGET